MTDSTPTAPRDDVPRWRRKNVIAIAIALSIGAFYVFTSCGPDDQEGASDRCHESIENLLKAPRSAEFSDEVVRRYGDDWEFSGSVDSQNGYGVMIRSSWTCTVRKGSDGTWLIQSRDVER